MGVGIRRIEYRSGETVFREGDDSRAIYVLESGTIEIRRGEAAIAFITDPGSYLGEMSFLLDRPRSGTAVAMEHSVVLAIPESEIERTVASDPNLALKLARTLARRLARTSEQLKDLLEISSRRARAETFDDFLGNLPYSRREQLLLETAQATWLDRQSGLSFVDARIRLRNLDRDLAEMRERRDMFADPIGHVADAAGLARPYEERLRAEFGRLAD